MYRAGFDEGKEFEYEELQLLHEEGDRVLYLSWWGFFVLSSQECILPSEYCWTGREVWQYYSLGNIIHIGCGEGCVLVSTVIENGARNLILISVSIKVIMGI